MKGFINQYYGILTSVADSDDLNEKPIECVENLGSQLGQEPQLFEGKSQGVVAYVMIKFDVPFQKCSDIVQGLPSTLKSGTYRRD